MGYFGGGGVQGDLHPSLRAYIDCFLSSPFPKTYPRGGGVWDQDPILMRDFRIIRAEEVRWRESQEQVERMKSAGPGALGQSTEGGSGGLSGALDDYISELEE